MKRGMLLILLGFEIITLGSGVFMAATGAVGWVSLLHFAGAAVFTILMIVHIWSRRRAARVRS